MDNFFLFVWLKIAVSWILVQFHSLLSFVMPADSGWTWVASIVCLVILIRIALIPLFVRQIKSQRNLQLIQPQIKELQKKYAGDRERQSQEMMKLYKETGTNPLASCLPILAQAPIFFALFGVLQGIAMYSPSNPAAHPAPGVFAWPQYAGLIDKAHNGEIFGVPLYSTFMEPRMPPGSNELTAKVLAMVLIVLMTATTFLTQRQLIVKNSAPDNPMVRQQKILLYVFPLVFAIGGINFPIGVLIYWFTTNLWSMGQQFWVIRNSPQPGTPAYAAREARRAKQSKPATSLPSGETDGQGQSESPPARVQPKKAPRSRRK